MSREQYKIYKKISSIELKHGYNAAVDWLVTEVKLGHISGEDCKEALTHLNLVVD